MNFCCFRTALHIACASGHVEVVQFLVENKAKLNLCDNQNRSALMKVILEDGTLRCRGIGTGTHRPRLLIFYIIFFLVSILVLVEVLRASVSNRQCRASTNAV